MSFLLNTGAAQKGIPIYVWIILGVIAGLVALILAIKSFWVSKCISTLLSIAGVVVSIMMAFANDEKLLYYTILGGVLFVIAFVFLVGNEVFNSNTEGVYLIGGSLLHDTNHPIEAFCGSIVAIAFTGGLLFWAAYAWTFVIALVLFVLLLALSVGCIIAGKVL